MVGGGRVFGEAHLYGMSSGHIEDLTLLTRAVDFPWASLGPATIVDIGGGVGKYTRAILEAPLRETASLTEYPTA